jgi:glycosyltransferase involved in cell wall biosynthesis
MVVEHFARPSGDQGAWLPQSTTITTPVPIPAAPNQESKIKNQKSQRPYLEQHVPNPSSPHPQYSGDLFHETQRYARLALSIAKGGEDFDIIHAHDWMTFPAAMAVAAAVHKPLVLQIHSTEYDRAGNAANHQIVDIEREGMLAASKILAVSQQTKSQLVERYHIAPDKIEVVHNAPDPDINGDNGKHRRNDDARHPARSNVLFLGRLTEQKGPHLFLQAAKKVLSIDPAIHFTIAGHGEMLDALKDLVDSLNIQSNVHFTGFLGKKDREKALAAANLYVMPSISEPFGIASLDALAHNVPVIISRTSGVAEVLRHVLKVDFWDTEDLANKILAVLHHPPLAETLKQEAHLEARHLSWDHAASQILTLYRTLTRPTRRPAPITTTK